MDTTTIIITLTTAIFASTGFWAVVNQIYQNRSNKKSSSRAMLLGLAHDRIFAICKKALREGEISTDDYENLTYLYKGYKALGGNGTGELLYNNVSSLRIADLGGDEPNAENGNV